MFSTVMDHMDLQEHIMVVPEEDSIYLGTVSVFLSGTFSVVWLKTAVSGLCAILTMIIPGACSLAVKIPLGISHQGAKNEFLTSFDLSVTALAFNTPIFFSLICYLDGGSIGWSCDLTAY